MMLGKRGRQRPPMKRNTSMTEFSYDDLSLVIPSPSAASDSDQSNPSSDQNNKVTGFMCPIPRSLNRRNSGDFVLESNGTFLRTCSLCSRRLAPTRDIYMYRGDSAFCSLECRQQQMTKDEWKEKSVIKKKETNSSSSHSTTVDYAVPSTKGEKIVAL